MAACFSCSISACNSSIFSRSGFLLEAPDRGVFGVELIGVEGAALHEGGLGVEPIGMDGRALFEGAGSVQEVRVGGHDEDVEDFIANRMSSMVILTGATPSTVSSVSSSASGRSRLGL